MRRSIQGTLPAARAAREGDRAFPAFVPAPTSSIEGPADRPRRFLVSASAPSFDAPLLVGAQIEARANHPDVGDRVLLRQNDRTWTYRRYRDECVRLAHFLRRRLGPIDAERPGPVSMLLQST